MVLTVEQAKHPKPTVQMAILEQVLPGTTTKVLVASLVVLVNTVILNLKLASLVKQVLFVLVVL